MFKFEALSIVGVPDPVTSSVDPSKVRFCSAFKLVPVPPVITLLSDVFTKGSESLQNSR